jgi:hypothetical protein
MNHKEHRGWGRVPKNELKDPLGGRWGVIKH